MPVAFPPEEAANRGAHYLKVLARLKPNVTLAQARAEMDTIAARLAQQYPEFNTRRGAVVNPLHEEFVGNMKAPLWILLGAVAFVLLIACANVANLLLARATGRKREIAIRAAVGAHRARILRQLLTESVALAVAGGTLGLLAAQWGTKALLRLSGNRELQASPDLRVFLFTAGVCVLTGILFGLIPALKSRHIAVAATLKSGPQTANARVGWNWGKILVAAQVAVSLLVLFSAGLLVRSLRRLAAAEFGVKPRRSMV